MLTNGIVAHKVHDLVHVLIDGCLGEQCLRTRLVHIEQKDMVTICDDVNKTRQITTFIILVGEFRILVQPLNDVKPDLRIPGRSGTVADVFAGLADKGGVVRLCDDW